MNSQLVESGDLYTGECINHICEFQNGTKMMEKGRVPKDELDPCIFCGSPVRWFSVYLEEDIILPSRTLRTPKPWAPL